MYKSITRTTLLIGVLLFVFIAENSQAQVGSQLQERINRITEPGQLGDTLSVWGDVRIPGRYIVPRGAEVAKVMQYAGGPTGSRIGSGQNAWTRTRISISISQFDQDTGEMNYHQFHMRYNDEISREMRNFQLSNDDIVTVEVRQRAGFMDVLGVVGPILGTITTSYLLYDRIIR